MNKLSKYSHAAAPSTPAFATCYFTALVALHLQHGVPLDSDEDLSSVSAPDAPARPPVSLDSLTSDQLLRVMLPPSTYPSIAQLQNHGIYLLEHTSGLFLYVGIDADEDLLRELFGPECSNALSVPTGQALPALNTDLSLRLWTIIAAIRSRRPPHLPLTVIGPVDSPIKDNFARLLVEDKIGDSESYVDLLCEMHKAIQNRLTAS